MDNIPVVDFGAMNSLKAAHEDCPSAAIKQLADEIYQAFSTVGFIYLKNHGILQEKVTNSLFSFNSNIIDDLAHNVCSNP